MSGNSAQWPVLLGLDHTPLCESAEAEKLRIAGLCGWSNPEKMQPRDWPERVARIQGGVSLGAVQTVSPKLNLREGHREWLCCPGHPVRFI